MPKDVIGKNSIEQDKLKGTVWELFHGMLEKLQAHLEALPAADNEKKAGEKLQADLAKLLEQMSSQYQRRNRMGNYLPMTQEEYHNLHEQFETCLKDVRAIKGPLAQFEDVRALRTALARGRNGLMAHKEDHLPALAQALSGLLPSTVRLVDTDIEEKHGGMSSRLAVKYTDELGVVHEGFLTKDEDVLPKYTDSLNAAAESIAKKYPDYADAIRDSAKDKEFLLVVGTRNIARWDAYSKEGNHPWLNRLEGPQKKQIYEELLITFLPVLNKNAVLRNAGIRPGSKLAYRNSAMSDVARRLGFPELLAESRRVTIEQNGKKIDAVMMEAADMDAVDNGYKNEDSPFLAVDYDQFDSKAMLSSLADLQILDYLCANTDRHKGNFFTRFDLSDPSKPKISGLQGIDNDNSFGDIGTGGVGRLAKPDNLRIITPKMAAAVENMTHEDLEEILGDYGLSEGEKKAANARLDTLKDYIKQGKMPQNQELNYREQNNGKIHIRNNKGSIHIVRDEEWEKLTLTGLATLENGDGKENIFNQMVKQMEVKQDMESFKVSIDTRKDKVQYTEQDVHTALEQIREALEEEYQKVRKMKKLLAGKCKESQGGNTTFTDLAEAVNDLNGQYERILEDTAHIRTMDDETIEKLDSFYATLEANRAWLGERAAAYKNSHTGLRFSPMGRGRKELAEKLSEFVSPEKPESRELYDKNKTEIKEGLSALYGKNEKNEKNGKVEKIGKSSYEELPHAANRLVGLMESTMKRNMEKHSRSGETYTLGLMALEAQRRLWNYSQSQAVEEPVSEKENSALNEAGKEQISFEQLVQDKEPIRKDMRADVRVILNFVGKQSSSAQKKILSRLKHGDVQALSGQAGKKSIQKEQTVLGKNEMRIDPRAMTPKEAISFLGMVFEQEARMANNGKAKKKPAPAKQKGKG